MCPVVTSSDSEKNWGANYIPGQMARYTWTLPHITEAQTCMNPQISCKTPSSLLWSSPWRLPEKSTSKGAHNDAWASVVKLARRLEEEEDPIDEDQHLRPKDADENGASEKKSRVLKSRGRLPTQQTVEIYENLEKKGSKLLQ